MVRPARLPSSDDFLRLFDPDPVRAATKCEQLSERLVAFFRRRGCVEPEDLAQETMARGFGKILTVDLHVEPAHYFYGIAKMLFLEDLKKSRRRKMLVPFIENLAADSEEVEPADVEREQRDDAYGIPSPPCDGGLPEDLEEATKLLAGALRRLPRRDAKLLIKYLRADARKRVALARKLRINPGALRTRCCRIHKRLKQLIRRP